MNSNSLSQLKSIVSYFCDPKEKAKALSANKEIISAIDVLIATYIPNKGVESIKYVKIGVVLEV